MTWCFVLGRLHEMKVWTTEVAEHWYEMYITTPHGWQKSILVYPCLFYSVQHLKSQCQPHPANKQISLLISTLQQPFDHKIRNATQILCSQKRIQQYAVQVTLLHLADLKYQLWCNFPLSHGCVTPKQHKPYMTILLGKCINANIVIYTLYIITTNFL